MLKGVNYWTKMAKQKSCWSKSLTQKWKKYLTYFKHKRPENNET